MSDKPSKLKIADREFTSRLLVGTGKFASNELMRDALEAFVTGRDEAEWMRDEDREAIARRLADARGATLVPADDHPLIMAGQGTAALELVEEVGDLDWLVMPVGGGGLLSGCTIAATALQPRLKVIGVETETSNDWVLSLEAGHPIHIPPPDTIADGIRTQQPGSLTFPIVQALGHGVKTVSDEEVKQAMRFLLLRMKLLVEPTGAVPVALLLSGRLPVRGQRVGVILSGGNADPGLVAQVLGP